MQFQGKWLCANKETREIYSLCMYDYFLFMVHEVVINTGGTVLAQ